ncbi:hypothetical protein BJP40_19995 [Streptomyces sp. CC53]|uniref:hypothetical protein n=1 Tax=unclassified Streptomyces TaxID=2593676 RepID=UPI0008DD8C72|nr:MULTISPECIES: hypothetical protein [unclassified Streptomyces]OII64622.1 hypothetical protein BJP40_19995 [Streptomyces sp. CC53]
MTAYDELLFAVQMSPEVRPGPAAGALIADYRAEVLREARAYLESRLPSVPVSRQAGVEHAIGALLDLAAGGGGAG